jgi:hypothetical protein
MLFSPFNLLQWQAGMNVRACSMLPSVKILAVKVRFSQDMEAKMLPTLLRCFPQLETLHIMVQYFCHNISYYLSWPFYFCIINEKAKLLPRYKKKSF